MDCIHDELNDTMADVLSTFNEDLEEEELDLSSCDLYEFPTQVLKLDLNRVKCLTLDHNCINNLPNSINLLERLTKLSLAGNDLNELPHEITLLENLRVLVLDENELCCLPELIGDLQSLSILSVIGNRLTDLPKSITNLRLIEELYLDENRISLLPHHGWSNMKSLKTFEISDNLLTSLPDDFGELCVLQVFNANSNSLTTLPHSFNSLNQIEILDLSNNQISRLPEEFASSEVIKKLYLENNAIKMAPSWFHCLYELEELTLAENELCLEPFDFEFCQNTKKLKKLEAGTNFMETLATNFGSLSVLETLHLGTTIGELERSNFQNGNWIKVLPDSFCQLSNLKKANINENQIACLPDMIGNLIQLSWLDLGQNMLEHLPETFCDLVNLEFLQLSKNQLKDLPSNIGCLQKLVDFRLDNNLLTNIPDSLSKMKALKSLDLFNNELTEIPAVIYSLKNLRRLDLDQNKFSLKLTDIPKMTPGNDYPERDPNLQNNWRGKTREDKKKITNVVEVKIDMDAVDDDEEEVEWNENALRMAMQRGMSLWRSHNGSASREIVSVKGSTDEVETDENWYPSTYNTLGMKSYIPGINACRIKRTEKSDPCEEDWDQEIETFAQYNNVLEDCYERKFKTSSMIDDFQNSINRYPPSRQAYTSTAGYESFVYKQGRTQTLPTTQASLMMVIDGQFDDVE